MTRQTANQINPCNGERLSQFVDGELSETEKNQIEYHLTHCENCRIELNRVRLLANTCQSMLDESRIQKDLAGLEGRIISRIRQPENWREMVWDFIHTKKVLIPVSAVGTILAVFGVFHLFFSPPMSPSAIITSINGDFSSVMVMETPESHQTIIWIRENT